MIVLRLIYWWISLPLQVAILFQMVRHRTFRDFPWFFAYTLFSVLANISRISTFSHNVPRFYTYWVTDGVYAVLGTAVMYEVFRRVFRGFANVWWFRLMYPVTVLLATALAIAVLKITIPGAHNRPIMRWIIAGELGVRVIEVATFVLLVVLVLLFGLKWRQHAFGISAGFGLYSTAALLAYTKYYEIGTRFLSTWNTINLVAYDIAVLIWLWYFTGPRVPEEARTDPPPLSVHELESYKEALRKVRRP